MSPTPVEPFVITTSQTIVSFSVTCRTLILFDNASFTVDSFDKNGNIVNRQIVPITEEQYSQWNNDDNYIINLMAEILGYTLVNPVQNGVETGLENGVQRIFNVNVNGP
jgi:hypothetical protein